MQSSHIHLSRSSALLDIVKSQVDKRDVKSLHPKKKEPAASQFLGVDSIFAALFLASEDSKSSRAQAALDHMWANQIHEGKDQGSWFWLSLDLDPWETADSAFYGAATAAAAVAMAGPAYRSRTI